MKGFYSPIERLAAESTRGKGTGEEFMTELSKKPGYKQAEVEDRDLQALMALPKMAREEFMAQLKAKGAVMPRERILRGKLDPKDLTYEEEYERQNKGIDSEVHHEDYTLPGGENYREILLQHPKGSFPGVGAHFGGAPNVLASIRVKDRVIPGEVGYTMRNKKSGFKGQHYGTAEEAQAAIEGYPEHLRPMLDVVPNRGPDKKILHIEEIQSDWHQQGREKGYATKEHEAQLQAARKQAEDAEFQHKQLKRDLDKSKEWSDTLSKRLESGHPDFAVGMPRRAETVNSLQAHNENIMDLMPQVMRADEIHRRAREERDRLVKESSGNVPDAPFKKNWHELALKRMIQHAAEKGYDQIAITPGEEQAKRYGLSQHVGMVSYNPDEQHFQAFKPNRETLMNEKGASPERVAELIGKDAATRLMSAPAQMGHHFLEGEDLNVGGEGMKGFYDKMVPKFLNQFGKKYGAQVGKTSLSVKTGKHAIYGPEGDLLKTLHGDDRAGEAQALASRTPGSQIKFTPGEQTTLHAFPITPEMRADVTKNGIPMYAEGGAVDEADVPRETVKAYKLFRVHPKHPGKLFPLFVDANTPVEMNKWIAAKEGEMANGKVKSKIGPLAYRPGWHAGDLPIATHIGEKSDPSLTAPDVRPEHHAWAEVEMPNDVDWQAEATKRGTNKQGKLIPVRAHITDQLPEGGHYRYKTNPNMTGNWLIGGSMKVNRVLTDKEVRDINKAAGLADLPRSKPFNAKKFGFASGGLVGPEEWKAEEHVNYTPGKAKFLEGSHTQQRLYHGTTATEGGKKQEAIRSLKPSKEGALGSGVYLTPDPAFAGEYAKQSGGNVLPVHARITNPLVIHSKRGEDPMIHALVKLGMHPDKAANMVEKAYEQEGYIGKQVQTRAQAAGHDALMQYRDGKLEEVVHYNPRMIKSATGNRGTYDTSSPELSKAKGGSVKPTVRGIIKERVTVSPNMDAMQYELLSAKHFTKKVK